MSRNVHISFVYISQTLKTMKIVFSKWVVKLALLYHVILLSNEKELPIDIHSNLNDPQENYAAWKRPITKGCILCELYNRLERTKLWRWRTNSCLQRIRNWVGVLRTCTHTWLWKGVAWGSFAIMEQLYILILVIVTWSYTRIKVYRSNIHTLKRAHI